MKKYKNTIILTSIITLLPCIFGLIMWDSLPDLMPSHFGLNGKVDGWSSKPFVIFGTPITLFIFHMICVAAVCLDKRNKNQTAKAVKLSFWIFPVLSILIAVTIYTISMDYEFNFTGLFGLPIGVMFIVMGNYFPKIKQNRTVGIRVKWTLENEENWNKSHRFGGKVWVICGIIILFGMVLPLNIGTAVQFAAIMTACFVPIIYSYVYYRKQLKEGTYQKIEIYSSKLAQRVSIIIVAIIIIAVTILMFTGDITYKMGEDKLEISATFWSDISVKYDEIDSIEYIEDTDRGTRTYGFGSFRLGMGLYNSESYGDYTRYCYYGCDEAIKITSSDEILIINAKTELLTQNLYNELLNKTA